MSPMGALAECPGSGTKMTIVTFVTMNLFFFSESVMSFYISTIGQENKMRQHYRYFFTCWLDLQSNFLVICFSVLF